MCFEKMLNSFFLFISWRAAVKLLSHPECPLLLGNEQLHLCTEVSIPEQDWEQIAFNTHHFPSAPISWLKCIWDKNSLFCIHHWKIQMWDSKEDHHERKVRNICNSSTLKMIWNNVGDLQWVYVPTFIFKWYSYRPKNNQNVILIMLYD